MILSFVIPLDARTKKNSPQVFSRVNKQTGRVFTKVLPSKNYLQFEKDCLPFLKGLPHITGPVNLQAVFYMKTRRNVDLVGLLQSIDDVLTTAGVLADDCRDIIDFDFFLCNSHFQIPQYLNCSTCPDLIAWIF